MGVRRHGQGGAAAPPWRAAAPPWNFRGGKLPPPKSGCPPLEGRLPPPGISRGGQQGRSNDFGSGGGKKCETFSVTGRIDKEECVLFSDQKNTRPGGGRVGTEKVSAPLHHITFLWSFVSHHFSKNFVKRGQFGGGGPNKLAYFCPPLLTFLRTPMSPHWPFPSNIHKGAVPLLTHLMRAPNSLRDAAISSPSAPLVSTAIGMKRKVRLISLYLRRSFDHSAVDATSARFWAGVVEMTRCHNVWTCHILN